MAVSLRIQNDPDGCCLFVNRKPNWWVCNVFLIKGSFREENAPHQFGKHFIEARLWAFIRASPLFSGRNRQPSIHPIKIISCQWIMYLWIFNYAWFSPSCHILNKIITGAYRAMVLKIWASLFVYFKVRADIFELCGGLQSSAHTVNKDTIKWNGMCSTWKQLSSNWLIIV